MKGEALLDGRRVLLTHARRPPERSSLWEKKSLERIKREKERRRDK
jgi:hypothetical protein